MRRVYVSPRGAVLHKHGAYLRAAKQVVADHCKCRFAEDAYLRCRLHAVCCAQRREGENNCEHSYPMPYYRRVVRRLARFLKFVDARFASKHKDQVA